MRRHTHRINLVSAVAVLALMGVLAGCGETQQAQAPAPASTATVFDGARIITGDGNAIENGTLVIDGTRIVAAGLAAEVTTPEGATHVDVSGKTIMPAIIDAHTHLNRTPEELIVDLKQRAYYGEGAVMSLGQDQDIMLPVRDMDIPGATRFFSAGRGIVTPEPGCSTAPFWVNNVDEIRAALDTLAMQKVTIVKIYVDTWDRFPKMSPELYGPLIQEAHMRGLKVIAHLRELEDAKGLLRAGVDAFAHNVRIEEIDDELVELWKQNPNVVLVATLPGMGAKTDITWLKDSLLAEQYAQMEKNNDAAPEQRSEAFNLQARNLAKLNAVGAKIALGTDGNTNWSAHTQMEGMVAAGMTPMQALVAATRNGAELMQIADMGTLEAGKSADFIVLDANPLDDITNTRKIKAVYLRGAAVDRSPGTGGGAPFGSALCPAQR